MESPAYIFVADSMGLYSFKFFLVGSVKRIFSARVRVDRSRSSKVFDYGIYITHIPPEFWRIPAGPDHKCREFPNICDLVQQEWEWDQSEQEP